MEHRKSIRYELSLPARIFLPSNDEFYLGSTTDVSNCGAFVRTKRCIPLGSSLNLELELGMGRLMRLIGEKHKTVTVVVEGKVVRQGDDGVGVAFGRKYNFLTA